MQLTRISRRKAVGRGSIASRSLGVSGLLTLTLLAGACSHRPAELSTIDIAQPGKVLVDHEARRGELKNDDLCPVWQSALPQTALSPIVGVEAPSGYGIDWRFAAPRDGMMKLGAACLKLGGKPCGIIVDTMVSWSQAGAAIVESSGDNSRFWNDSITVNLDVVRPFVGAYAIARSSVAVAPEEDARIREWIEAVLWRSRHLLRGVHRKGRNYAAHNHAVASAAALMAHGAMWGDSTAFGHGVDQWFITLGDMRGDGSLPIETRRGARALFYTGRTLSGLMSIAEMARTQGIDLYSSGPSGERTIHKAVAFMLDALENNDVVLPYASENFFPGPHGNWRQQDLGRPGSTFGWAIPYVARFPDHANARRLSSLKIDRRIPTQDVLNYVLAPDSAVMGHWIGGRADCLYRAP